MELSYSDIGVRLCVRGLPSRDLLLPRLDSRALLKRVTRDELHRTNWWSRNARTRESQTGSQSIRVSMAGLTFQLTNHVFSLQSSLSTAVWGLSGRVLWSKEAQVGRSDRQEGIILYIPVPPLCLWPCVSRMFQR